MNLKNYWIVFSKLWKMQWKNYWKDYVNLFLGWLVTLITLVVWLSFRDTNPNSAKHDPFVLAAAIGISTVRNALLNFSVTLYWFKNNKMFHKLFSTPVSKKFIFFCLIIFNQFTNLLVTIFLFSVGMLYSEQRMILIDVNWLITISGWVLLAITCNLLAFCFVFLIKKFEYVVVIGNIYYFAGVYFLGLGMPLNVVAQSKLIAYISYIFITKYSLNLMQAGWINSTNMSVPNSNIDLFGYNYQLWIPYAISLIVIFILTIIVFIKFIVEFSFGNRKFRRVKNIRDHFSIISLIRKSNTIEDLRNVIKLRNEILIKSREGLKKQNGPKNN